jgi:hypothetical protein
MQPLHKSNTPKAQSNMNSELLSKQIEMIQG